MKLVIWYVRISSSSLLKVYSYSNVDVERLAAAVFREKVVWSCKDPLHCDRNIVASAWTRIGLEIGTQDQ